MKPKSRTTKALEYLRDNPKETPYAAAKFADIQPSVIYRAIAAKNRPRCPECGHLIESKP